TPVSSVGICRQAGRKARDGAFQMPGRAAFTKNILYFCSLYVIKRSMMKHSSTLLIVLSAALAAGNVSCKKNTYSEKTGWKFNDPEWGGFQKYKKVEQAAGPGLIVVEGGTFVLGNLEQDLMHTHNAAE